MKNTNMIYKQDLNGNIREYFLEYDHEKWRSVSGIQNGAKVESGWIYPEATNVGRANERSVEEQVLFEVQAQMTKQLNQGKYHKTIEDAMKGATFYEAMLASKYDAKKHTDFPYLASAKYDGIRAIVSIDGIQSRNGKPIVSCPHIMDALKPFFEKFPNVVLDGELYNHDLHNDFEKIVSMVRKSRLTESDFKEIQNLVQYHVYDIISDRPAHERISFLFENLTSDEHIQVCSQWMVKDAEEIDVALAQSLEENYEGLMLRNRYAPYEGKRSKNLLKVKTFEDAEFKIVDIIEGVGNWSGMAKAIEIELPDGTTQQAGMRGAFAFAAELLTNKSDYIGTDVTIRYQNKTADNKLRFPIAVTFWKGKRDL